jgi:hypothetical protein
LGAKKNNQCTLEANDMFQAMWLLMVMLPFVFNFIIEIIFMILFGSLSVCTIVSLLEISSLASGGDMHDMHCLFPWLCVVNVGKATNHHHYYT